MSRVNNCQWIQYSQLISRGGWNLRQKTDSSQSFVWGYENNFEVQAGLNDEKNDWEKLFFDFFMMPSQDYLRLRVCFPWLRGSVIYGSAWFYDYCVIRIALLDQKNETAFTKCFHVEPESQGCGMPDHCSSEEIAGYQNDKFISISELQRLCGYVPDLGKPTFIPVKIGITMRIHKGYSKDLFLPIVDIRLTFCSRWKPQVNAGNHSGKKKLRSSSSTSDVAFVLNAACVAPGMDCDLIPAHKAVLIANSPVLEVMFETEMQEKETGLIQLEPDISSEAVRVFLDYLYDVTPDNFVENIDINLQVLKLAHKYQVQPLYELCVQNIIGNPNSVLSPKAVLDIFNVACMYDEWDLKYRTAQWVRRNETKVKDKEFKPLMEFYSELFIICDVTASI